MRSIKLLVAMAAIAALVSGPVLAQEAAPASTEMMAPAADAAPAAGKSMTKKHSGKKHTGKKHHSKKTAAPAQ